MIVTNTRITFLLFFIFSGLISHNSLAQRKREIKYSGFFDSYYYEGPFNYTFGGGLSLYSGDLCKNLGCNNFSYHAGIGANYRILPRIIVGGEFNYFTLSADDEVLSRSISFTSSNFEFIGYGRFYIIDDIIRVARDRSRKPKIFKPYVSLGAGLMYYNPTSFYTPNPLYDTLPHLEEGVGYPRIGFMIPLGVGISWFISHKISLITEVNYRYTFSDYLDDVGAVRGNPGKKDAYALVSLKLQYTPNPIKGKKKKSKKSGKSGGDSDGSGGNGGSGGQGNDEGGENQAAPAKPESTPEDKPAVTPTEEEKPAEVPAEEQPEENNEQKQEENQNQNQNIDGW
jgi:uncharacterized membrane protein YgcG